METYTITEAKIKASRNRSFYNTTLTIEQNGDLIAYKEGAGKWVNT